VTYSIVARDPDTGALGVAVQSHFFGVGRIVTWAEAGVGAVATQSFADPAYGPRGLELMREGASARDALKRLVAQDRDAEVRQVGMVDLAGACAAHTGARCVAEAGHAFGEQAAAQGNMMLRATVWDAMVEAVAADGVPFVGRLLRALEAAEAEGGDIRGKQSAALLLVSGRRSERPWEEVLCNVRVDDHPEPLRELRRLVDYHSAYNALGRALFTPGVVTGEFTVRDADVAEVLAELAEAQEILGDNPEPTVWRAVLLARAGRLDDARKDFQKAMRANPALKEFVARLSRAGFMPEAELERIVSSPRGTAGEGDRREANPNGKERS
jgi:uncharacterized Ntn-hydrolase superfamily protein